MRILIVEDQQDVRFATAESLRMRGDSVDEVSTIKQAMQYVEQVTYSVVVLDRMLPDGDSLELLKQIRQSQNPYP